MSHSADPFVVSAETALLALALAKTAACGAMELRGESTDRDLHMALFRGDSGAAAIPDATDSPAVLAFMDGLLIAEAMIDDSATVVAGAGFSRKDSVRLKAFECLHTGLDSYVAILARKKFDGATRTYGSHRFSQYTPDGAQIALIASVSGWTRDQDQLTATIVAATLQYSLQQLGILPAEQIISESFVLTDGDWAYPADGD